MRRGLDVEAFLTCIEGELAHRGEPYPPARIWALVSFAAGAVLTRGAISRPAVGLALGDRPRSLPAMTGEAPDTRPTVDAEAVTALATEIAEQSPGILRAGRPITRRCSRP